MLTRTEVLLLDSGVWVAAVNLVDRFESAARKLVADPGRYLGALDLTFYEVENAIGLKIGAIAAAADVCRTLERRCARATVRIDASLIDAALKLVAEYGLTSYDAAYVAVARLNDWTLVSTDLRDLVSKGFAVTPDAAV